MLSTRLATALMAKVDWASLHVDGGVASDVPAAVLALAVAGDNVAADVAYWRLDNNVVVQGEVFDAAAAIISPVLVLLAGPLAAQARVKFLDLLIELHGARPHRDEFERSGDSVASECTRRIRDGRWLYYAAACDPTPEVRRSALDLLADVEGDADLRSGLLHEWSLHDPEAEVRQAAEWWLRD